VLRFRSLFQNGYGLYLDQKIPTGKGENPDPSAGGQLIWRKKAEQGFPHWARIEDVLSHDVEAQGHDIRPGSPSCLDASL
jgi:hypothetical protein